MWPFQKPMTVGVDRFPSPFARHVSEVKRSCRTCGALTVGLTTPACVFPHLTYVPSSKSRVIVIGFATPRQGFMWFWIDEYPQVRLAWRIGLVYRNARGREYDSLIAGRWIVGGHWHVAVPPWPEARTAGAASMSEAAPGDYWCSVFGLSDAAGPPGPERAAPAKPAPAEP